MPTNILPDLDLSDILGDVFPEAKVLPLRRDATPRWHAQARVLVVQRTECACGATFEAPAAIDLLVRFVSRTGMEIEEIANHPAGTNAALPIARRVLVQPVNVCQRCVEGAAKQVG